MRIKGLRAIYPSPRTRRPALEHRGYHDLLEKVRVTRPNQAWAADITYIPMVRGFFTWWPSETSTAGVWWLGSCPTAWTPASLWRPGQGAGKGKASGLQHGSGQSVHLKCLEQVPDPRKARGVRHPFQAILRLTLFGLVCGQTTIFYNLPYCGTESNDFQNRVGWGVPPGPGDGWFEVVRQASHERNQQLTVDFFKDSGTGRRGREGGFVLGMGRPGESSFTEKASDQG